MKYLLFFLTVLVANIIQGITGFAGTILAMPPSIMLVGFDVAKPILNVLGILSGVYVYFSYGKDVNWKEFKKIIIIMVIGIVSGLYLKTLFIGKEAYLYKILGTIVIILAVQGLYKNYKKKQVKSKNKYLSYVLLVCAGIVHGMFVCGGPLLISYLSDKIKDKVSFRATISTVWIVLNTIILLDDIKIGLITSSTIKLLIVSIPFLFFGMYIGTKLYKKMNQEIFMKLTYSLLIISGLSLFIK